MIFVDASALCAVLLGEPDGETYAEKIKASEAARTSSLAVFETVLAVAREVKGDVGMARRDVEDYLRLAAVQLISVGDAEGRFALDAFERFGKGRHPARLNMGDCFAYACARAQGVPLLFKGDDFAMTDIAVA